MMRIFPHMVFACVLLASCEEAIESKSYFMENDEARKAQLIWCEDRPDQIRVNGNCLNAAMALQEKIEGLKKDRALLRQQRWDMRSSLIIEREKCGDYKNNESFKACRSLVREEIKAKHEDVNAFHAETNRMIGALK